MTIMQSGARFSVYKSFPHLTEKGDIHSWPHPLPQSGYALMLAGSCYDCPVVLWVIS